MVCSDIVAAAMSSWDEPTWLWALPPRSRDPEGGRGLSSSDLRISALELLLRRICGLRLLRGHGLAGLNLRLQRADRRWARRAGDFLAA